MFTTLYKITCYFLSIITGFTGFICLALSCRDLIWGHTEAPIAVIGIVVGGIFILGSVVIYDSLWKF
jgi:hypothetical protein